MSRNFKHLKSHKLDIRQGFTGKFNKVHLDNGSVFSRVHSRLQTWKVQYDWSFESAPGIINLILPSVIVLPRKSLPPSPVPTFDGRRETNVLAPGWRMDCYVFQNNLSSGLYTIYTQGCESSFLNGTKYISSSQKSLEFIRFRSSKYNFIQNWNLVHWTKFLFSPVYTASF